MDSVNNGAVTRLTDRRRIYLSTSSVTWRRRAAAKPSYDLPDYGDSTSWLDVGHATISVGGVVQCDEGSTVDWLTDYEIPAFLGLQRLKSVGC